MKKVLVKIFKSFLYVFLICLVGFLSVYGYEKISNQNKYLIFVEDSLIYDELTKSLENGFQIKIGKTKLQFTNTTVHPKNTVIVGNISKIKSFEFNAVEKSENQEIFKIQEERFLPSVKMDFSSYESENLVKLPPDFSVSITKLSDMPENHRGVKVEEKYVTENDYPLTENTFLVASFFYEEFREPILEFLEQYFLQEDCKIKLVKTEEKSENQQPLFVAGVGDMMVARGVQETLIYGKEGLNYVFNDTLPLLQNSDLTLGNLEGAITSKESLLPKTYNFKFDKRVLPSLKAAGFDYLMINNNHIFDYGVEGFLDSIEALKEAQIATSGVGKNYSEASKFYFTKVKNQDVAIISIGAYPKEVSGFDGKNYAATETSAGVLWKNEKIYEDIKSLKEKGYLIIANVHDGNEYEFVPNKSQKDFAKKLIENGVNLVLETHTHVLQPIERYKEGLIAYGLGNFIFPGMEEIPGATESLVLRVGFVDGKPIYVEPYPCKIDGLKVSLY